MGHRGHYLPPRLAGPDRPCSSAKAPGKASSSASGTPASQFDTFRPSSVNSIKCHAITLRIAASRRNRSAIRNSKSYTLHPGFSTGKKPSAFQRWR